MSTKAELIVRISAEARIISETLITDYDQIRTYVIRHERTRNVNVEGRTVTLWVYDEGGANEEALMDYDQWLDVPLSVRLSDYIDTLPPTISVRNIGYMTAYIVRFTEVTNTGIKTEKIGIWNEQTDKLDVYESTEIYDPVPGPTTEYPAFSQGTLDTATSFNPRNGKSNAIKVPLFNNVLVEYPVDIAIIDIDNNEIVLPAKMLIALAHVTMTFSTLDTTNNDGTNFHFQWQVDGNWIGVELSTGFIKAESSSWNYGVDSYLIDEDDGIEHRFSFWCWCTDRQGPVTIQECSAVVEEKKVPGGFRSSPIYYAF